MSDWQPIETAPYDRYILLCDKNAADWDGNMEVGKYFGEPGQGGCFWSCGGPNGGLELDGDMGWGGGHYHRFTHWTDLPEQPK